jgi:hypothetical protein
MAEAIEKVQKMKEKHDEAAAALGLSSEQMTNFAHATELQNLKLDEQIAKLEGRPTTNKPAEALEAARKKGEELIKTLEKVLAEQDKVLKGRMDGFFQQVENNVEGKGQVNPIIQGAQSQIKEIRNAISELKAAQNSLELDPKNADKEKEVTTAQAHYDKLIAQYSKFLGDQKTLIEQGDEIHQGHLAKVAEIQSRLESDYAKGDSGYREQQQKMLDNENAGYAEQMRVINDLTNTLTGLAIAKKAVAQQDDKSQALAKLTDQHNAVQQQIQTQFKMIDADKKFGEDQVSLRIAHAKELLAADQITIDGEKTLLILADAEKMAIERQAMERKREILEKDPLKDKGAIAAIDAEIQGLEVLHQTKLAEIITEWMKKREAEEAKTETKRLAAQKKAHEEAIKQAEAHLKSEMETLTGEEAAAILGIRFRNHWRFTGRLG